VQARSHQPGPATLGAAWFASRTLWTPPHHRLEGLVLPLELALAGGADVLHSPDFVVPRLWRGAAVATVHDLAFLRHPELLTGQSRRYYGQVHASVHRADAVIAVSEHTRRELLALTSVDPAIVHVVPNAIPPRFFAPGDPEADAAVLRRLGLEPPFVLFVGTIEPRKNVVVLLEAFRRLRDEGRDVRLVLAGADGWHSAPVYARAEALGLVAPGDAGSAPDAPASPAAFLGRVEDDDLLALYRSAAVLAHPALDEGFGLTPLEAMAAGTPAVVADAGALPEVTADAALHVPPGDPATWAAALGALLDDPARRSALSAAGRARAAEFTEARMAAGTWGVYEGAWAASHSGTLLHANRTPR